MSNARKPSASYPSIDGALKEFGARVDHLRQDLYYCDVLALNSSTRRDLLSSVRAGTYVWLASAFESLLRDLLSALVGYLNSANLTVSEARLSLLALLNASRLESLQEIRGLRMWQSRADLFLNIDGISTCSFRPEVTPLDGRTIRSEHPKNYLAYLWVFRVILFQVRCTRSFSRTWLIRETISRTAMKRSVQLLEEKHLLTC